jgi:hypothetical protein
MKLFKAALLSAAMVATGAIAAYAADPTPPVPANPPQFATNPGLPYSPTRTLGSKAGPSNSPSVGAPSATGSPWGTNGPSDSGGSYYSHSGFGPKPN